MKFVKKLYWICILVCISLVMFCDSSSSEGFLGFIGLAILIIVPLTRGFNKSSKNSADKWFQGRQAEIRADQVQYQTDMQVYHNMMEKASVLKKRASSTGGYERKRLLKEAEILERDAQKYYHSLI